MINIPKINILRAVTQTDVKIELKSRRNMKKYFPNFHKLCIEEGLYTKAGFKIKEYFRQRTKQFSKMFSEQEHRDRIDGCFSKK
ncbi:MAG TPA: hypothetical protein PLG15_06210 [Candidatus Gastranaerophilaceae bacterium]|nr:hypothetical protein [Candidatus Gastranaerophilaceae bacterium]HPT41958.1 hypothetical protein [Candidatus Gastranaerophilaceae bacterium]